MASNTIILGVTNLTRLIFDEEFPQLKKVDIEPYAITYSKTIPLSIKLIFDAPRILNVIKNEHLQLQHIIKNYSIDVVISDNRFGLYNESVESVYITHQLNIQAGFFTSLANRIHHYFIKKFNKVWVPDFENIKQSLAGKLSKHNALKKVVYIGPLSRLNLSVDFIIKKYDYLFLLSGAEPQRTVLEDMILSKIKNSSKRIVLIRGSINPLSATLSGNIDILNLPNANELAQCIKNADVVFCRSGYSSLMDLHFFKKQNIVLIPTPGQSEQLYLANYWKENFRAEVVLQKNFKDFKLT